MSDHPSPDLLAACIYGDLSGEEAASVQSHLSGCGECREQADSFRAVQAALNQWSMPFSSLPLPPESRAPAASRTAPRVSRLPRIAAAAACLVLGFAAGSLRPRHDGGRSADIERLAAENRAATDAALLRLQMQHDDRLRQLADALGERLDATERRQRELLSSGMQRLWSEFSNRTDSLRADLKAIAFVADTELNAARRRFAQIDSAESAESGH